MKYFKSVLEVIDDKGRLILQTVIKHSPYIGTAYITCMPFGEINLRGYSIPEGLEIKKGWSIKITETKEEEN